MKRGALAVLLAAAFALIVRGAFLLAAAAGFIAAGVALAVWACLFLLEVPERPDASPARP